MHIAARMGKLEDKLKDKEEPSRVLDQLLNAKAIVDARDNEGDTPMYFACQGAGTLISIIIYLYSGIGKRFQKKGVRISRSLLDII